MNTFYVTNEDFVEAEKVAYFTRGCSKCSRDAVLKLRYSDDRGHEIVYFTTQCNHWPIPDKADE